MSGPRIPDAAVEAGARGAFEVRDDPYDDDEWEDLDSADRELYECQSRGVLTAALPHIRRAVIEELAPLIRDLTDPDECWFDYYGGCQVHGYLSLQPGELCPHQEAKNLLRAEMEGGDRG